ncbi:MAG: S8 family peptidase [Candidatus Tumulicola sp.]
MNDLSQNRITQPLRDLANQRPAEIFHVVVRVVPAPDADAKTAYDTVPTILAQVEAAIHALDLGEGECMTWSGEVAVSPFLYAKLSGAHVIALDRQIPPNVPLEFRRDRTLLDETTQFNPEDLVARVIAEPLASEITRDPDASYDCIVVLNVKHCEGMQAARTTVAECLEALGQRSGPRIVYRTNDDASHPYVFARMTGAQVRALVDLDRNPQTGPIAIHQIWEDSRVQALITKSIATVKADAAQIAYSASGAGVVWGVLDSGIDVTHPHFKANGNLSLDAIRPVRHRDFTVAPPPDSGPSHDDAGAIVDKFGHGTHVAGIIAGCWTAPDSAAPATAERPAVIITTRNEAGADERSLQYPAAIAGMAPKCTLVSMRVLDDNGNGQVSSIIDAIEAIQQLNAFGRQIVIAGINLSVGYPFDAKWFACGQSPICVEVNRLVRSGVVVVTAAGNSGYGTISTAYTQGWSATLPQTINDPGNADLAITVGSTHREAPHLYGISYFSSKGPTGDGRLKPDLVAPGERIISCASAQCRRDATITNDDGSTSNIAADGYTYREDSGTSMAAPHVSGLIASFLSIRKEYVGQPEVVKALFVGNATDLKRDPTFQGAGLVDIMRAIQAV